MPKCEICDKELANPFSPSHINSKSHQDALKNLEIAKITQEETHKKEVLEPESKKYERKPIPYKKKSKTAPKKEEIKPPVIINSQPVIDEESKSYRAIKMKCYSILNSSFISLLIIVISIASGFTAIFETVSYIQKDYYALLITIEVIALCVLGTEFLLRVWICDIEPKYKNMKYKQLKHMSSFLQMVDLFSIVSIILGLIVPMGSEARGFVRIIHLIVFFKLIRYSQSFDIIWAVIKDKKEELLITMMLSLLLMFFGSVLIFLAEHEAQPNVFTNMFSSMWFTAINLFTIGYGDIVPVTTIGKLVSSVISVMGITLFLLPASIIGSGFLDEIQSRNPQFESCPQCHNVIERSQLLRDLFAKSKGKKSKIIMQALEEEEKTKKPQKLNYILLRKKLIHQNLEFSYPRNLLQFLVFVFFSTFITFNVLAIMVETNPVLYQENRAVLFFVFILSTVVFTMEYLLRVWSVVASEEQKFQDQIKRKLKYMRSFMGLVDLIFLVSLYLAIFLFFDYPLGIPFLLVLRMFVVLKIGHFIAVFEVIGAIFKDSMKEFFTTLLICVLFLLVASTVIYHLEKDAQPDKFRNIPATIWFGVITFTTTGFGDIYPVTTSGRLATICFAFLGVSLFTLPAGILGASFFNSMKEFRMYLICPKCGFIISKPILNKKRISN